MDTSITVMHLRRIDMFLDGFCRMVRQMTTAAQISAVMHALSGCEEYYVALREGMPVAMVGLVWGRRDRTLICFVQVCLGHDTHFPSLERQVRAVCEACVADEDEQLDDYQILHVTEVGVVAGEAA